MVAKNDAITDTTVLGVELECSKNELYVLLSLLCLLDLQEDFSSVNSLSNPSTVLYSSMGVAEQQLVEELLSKVREKDTLKSELEKVVRERDELELMVHSLDVSMDPEDDQDHLHDLIKVPDSASLNNSEVGCQHTEHEYVKAAKPVNRKAELSPQSRAGCAHSAAPATEDQPLNSQEMMNSGAVNSIEDIDSRENNEHQALLRKRHMRSKSFRGRGSIQFYSALEETSM